MTDGGCRFGVLGPFVFERDGRVVPIASGRQRALLTLLLAESAPLSRDRLIDELWGERPPVSSVSALHVHLSKLRSLLGGLLVRGPAGYTLDLEGVELDAWRFDALVDQARADPARARSLLSDALGLFRGEPLCDVECDGIVARWRRALEERRLEAIVMRVEADLAAGGAAELIAELADLVERHPFEERVWGQLMLALYRAGRQADALDAYQRARRRFAGELGLEPGEQLAGLQQRILERDSALAGPARGSNVPAGAAPRVGNLPVASTPFLGRANEIAETTDLLRLTDSRLLTLTGAGGSGKTRLAMRIAERCVQDYRDGAWFVGLSDVTDAELIVPTICHALGLVDQPGVTPTQRLGEWLKERELLLLLDNLEQLVDGVAPLGELLAGCPGLRLLVTSREPLRLSGEQQYEVPELDRAAAVELYSTRARAIESGFSVDYAIAGAICERLDYLPLAIELAAARTKALSPADTLARLNSRLAVLGAGPRDAPRRHQTLQATIDWSYDLMRNEEQRLFGRLAVFAGGCTLAAAEAVCDADLDTLQALTDRSLVRAQDGRYRMLQTLREYALERLDQAGETGEMRRRHATWFAELLETEMIDGYLQATPSDPTKLAVESENFHGALEWAAEHGESETVARIAAPLTPWVWNRRGQLNEAERWLTVAREHCAAYPLSLQANLLNAAGWLAFLRGEHDSAVLIYDEALAICRELGEPEGISGALVRRARSAFARGDLVTARAAFEEAILYARKHSLPHHLGPALMSLGDLAIVQGDLDEARALCEESLTVADDPGTNIDTSTALLNLTHIANAQRRHGDAATLGRRAVTVALSEEDSLTAAAAVMEIAWALADRGQHERSARLLGAGIRFLENAGVELQPTDVECEERTREILGAKLDAHFVQALFEEGRDTSLEEAVHDALSGSTGPTVVHTEGSP